MSITGYLIQPRGFCSGVNRAVKMVDQVIKLYKTVYIIEDIIHNKTFMKQLYENGLIKVDSIRDIPEGSVVMFSAHGVSREMFEIAEQRGLTIIDATCPVVKSIQNCVKKDAEEEKTIIIIGNRSHPEVIGLLGHAKKRKAFVVYNEMDVDLLPDMTDKEVVYFTQTTLDQYAINAVIDALKKRIPHIQCECFDNICNATKERQEAVKKIAQNVDLILVVGSAYSSNTNRLLEIAKEYGTKIVKRVENKDEIDLGLFNEIERFGITSGASAPESIVEEIVEYLSQNIDVVFEEYFDENKR